jgi:hypothetical protein
MPSRRLTVLVVLLAITAVGCSKDLASGPTTSVRAAAAAPAADSATTAPAAATTATTAAAADVATTAPETSVAPSTSVADTTTAPTTTEPATTAPATTEPATTVAPTTTAAPAPASTLAPPPAVPVKLAIIPDVVCQAGDADTGGYVQFGYTNRNPVPAAIAVGPDNAVSQALPDDTLLVPSVFAPGRVMRAFTATLDGNSRVAWSLKGPDGVTRTAKVTAKTRQCTSADDVDGRKGSVAVTYTVPPGTGPATTATITASLLGIPPTSQCAVGLLAQPILSWTTGFLDPSTSPPTSSDPIVAGLTVQRTVAFSDQVNRRTKEVHHVADAAIGWYYVDQCSGAGATTQSWPVDDQGTFAIVCLEDHGGGSISVFFGTVDCAGNEPLPATGGVQVRYPIPKL